MRVVPSLVCVSKRGYSVNLGRTGRGRVSVHLGRPDRTQRPMRSPPPGNAAQLLPCFPSHLLSMYCAFTLQTSGWLVLALRSSSTTSGSVAHCFHRTGLYNARAWGRDGVVVVEPAPEPGAKAYFITTTRRLVDKVTRARPCTTALFVVLCGLALAAAPWWRCRASFSTLATCCPA